MKVLGLFSLYQVEDKLGDFCPGIKIQRGGDLLFWIFFLKARVTLTMKRAILLSKITMTAICARIAAFLSPRVLGLARIQKSFLAEELVLSDADRSVLSFLCL